jgi:hypothetical protein
METTEIFLIQIFTLLLCSCSLHFWLSSELSRRRFGRTCSIWFRSEQREDVVTQCNILDKIKVVHVAVWSHHRILLLVLWDLHWKKPIKLQVKSNFLQEECGTYINTNKVSGVTSEKHCWKWGNVCNEDPAIFYGYHHRKSSVTDLKIMQHLQGTNEIRRFPDTYLAGRYSDIISTASKETSLAGGHISSLDVKLQDVSQFDLWQIRQ